MTLEEIRSLREQENFQNLRHSAPASLLSEDELDDQCKFMENFYLLLKERKLNTYKMIKLLIVKKMKGLNSISGDGTIYSPYVVDSIYGSGMAIRINDMFKDTLPTWVEKNFCFSNSLGMAYYLGCQGRCGKILSGIYDLGQPVLHSVIEIPYKDKSFVLDFNFNMMIERDFYFKLFNFEKLNETDFSYVVESIDVLSKMPYNVMFATFTFDDFISYINDEDRQQNNPLIDIE
ncbi:MAG: hypothetical protein IKC49_01835 [Clostridia bacterium]|nr:hypothetical protein [Clostridia bacterium]